MRIAGSLKEKFDYAEGDPKECVMDRGREGAERVAAIISSHYSREKSEKDALSALLLDIMRYCGEGKAEFPVVLSSAREALARDRERKRRAERK